MPLPSHVQTSGEGINRPVTVDGKFAGLLCVSMTLKDSAAEPGRHSEGITQSLQKINNVAQSTISGIKNYLAHPQ